MTVTRTTTVITPSANRTLATRDLFKMGPTKKDSDQDEYIDFLLLGASQDFEQICNRTFAQEVLQDAFRIKPPIFYPVDGRAEPLILSRRPVASIAAVVDYTCFQTALSASMAVAQTTLPCTAAFPSNLTFPFPVSVGNGATFEAMTVTGLASGTSYTVARSSTPVAHAAAAAVAQALDPSLYEVDPDTGLLTRLYDRGDGVMTPIGWRPGPVTVQFTAGYVLPGNTGSNLPVNIQRAVIKLARLEFRGKDRDPALRSQSAGEVGTQSFYVGVPKDVMDVAANYRDIKFGVY